MQFYPYNFTNIVNKMTNVGAKGQDGSLGHNTC